MRRAILGAFLLLAGCGRPASRDRAEDSARPEGLSRPTAGREAPGTGKGAGEPGRPPAAEMILDPVYTPREEDRVNLIADSTPAFSRAPLFDEFHQGPGPGDPDALKKMLERGEFVELEGRPPVLVLRNLDPADAREPGRHYPVEVRILAGARRGQVWFVDESALARLVPGVAHPPLAPGSYATVAGPGTTAYAGWEDLDPSAGPPGGAAGREVSRLEEGVRVVVQEVRGEAVRIRVDPGSGAEGRFGVVARSSLRPLVPPSTPIPTRPPAGP